MQPIAFYGMYDSYRNMRLPSGERGVKTGEVVFRDEFKNKPSAIYHDVFFVKNDTDAPVTKMLRMNGGAGSLNGADGALMNDKADRMSLTVGDSEVTLVGELKLAGVGNWYEQFYDIDVAEVTFPANSKTKVRITLSDSVNVDYFDFVDITA